jgi:hypothetical protein
MSKKIKIMLACLLSISCLTVFSPINFPSLQIKAYAEAATYSLADKGELKSLDVQSTDGQSLELCNNYGGQEKSLTDDKNYYVTLDGKSDGVKIVAEAEGDYIVKVFESDRDIATPHDVGENIPIQTGQTTLYIRTYATQDGFKRAVDDQDISNCAETYKIYINKSPADGGDDVGLSELTLDSGKVPITFNRDTTSYNIVVPYDEEDVEIKARPEDTKYDVKIGGFIADEDNKYKKDLHLQYGLNVIKIVITDSDYRIRTYTLNITRGNAANGNSSSAANTTQTNSNVSIPKINQWVQVNGSWEYYDSTGTPLKNNLFYDRNYGKTYYLKEDGSMAINWLYINNNWYYMGQDGAMKTGWQNVNDEWYYLDSNGIMKTGWVKDLNGKYYYLQANGIMAKNTKINGYEIGNDGTWVQ